MAVSVGHITCAKKEHIENNSEKQDMPFFVSLSSCYYYFQNKIENWRAIRKI